MPIAARAVSLTLACFACHAPAPAPPPAEDGAAHKAPSDGADETPDVTPSSFRFWVANAGLRAYDLDGNQVASLAELGDRAIRLADGRVVAVVPSGPRISVVIVGPDGQRQAEWPVFNAFDPDSCTPLPPVPAPADPEDEDWTYAELEMQSSDHFWVSADQRTACLHFQDRNDNMVSVGLASSVELDSGKLASAITLDMDQQCSEAELPPAAVRRRAITLGSRGSAGGRARGESEVTAIPKAQFSYDQATGWLRGEGNDQRADLCPDWIPARQVVVPIGGHLALAVG